MAWRVRGQRGVSPNGQRRIIGSSGNRDPLYVRAAGRPPWFEPRLVLGELGLTDTSGDRRRYAQRMRERAVDTLQTPNTVGLAGLRRGWCLGKESFRGKMLALLDGAGGPLRRRPPVDGAVLRAHGKARARELLKVGLEFFGLAPTGLGEVLKGDPRKLAVARVIRPPSQTCG